MTIFIHVQIISTSNCILHKRHQLTTAIFRSKRALQSMPSKASNEFGFEWRRKCKGIIKQCLLFLIDLFFRRLTVMFMSACMESVQMLPDRHTLISKRLRRKRCENLAAQVANWLRHGAQWTYLKPKAAWQRSPRHVNSFGSATKRFWPRNWAPNAGKSKVKPPWVIDAEVCQFWLPNKRAIQRQLLRLISSQFTRRTKKTKMKLAMWIIRRPRHMPASKPDPVSFSNIYDFWDELQFICWI